MSIVHTHPQLINESISELNKALDKSRYFYTDIKKDGVMLCDSEKYKLVRRRKLNYSEIAEIGQEYFEDKFGRATDFLEDAETNIAKSKYKHASFHLHQAAENYLRTMPIVYILYGYKEHDLAFLMNECKKHTLELELELAQIFPRDTEEEKHLFKLLQEAYVQASYNKNFVVTKEDIDALIPKIELLRDITEKVCKAQIEYYKQQTAK